MRKLSTLFLALLMTAMAAIPVLAADYSFSSGEDHSKILGKPTSSDDPVKPDSMNDNVRRNKDAAYFPPPYGVFSGDIPTSQSSPYHNNLRESGFVHQNQDLPAVGNEDYAPGSSAVSKEFLPTTSQTASLNTVPWYYADGSIGTLYVTHTGKTIKVYEGEDLENLKKGAGHFASTSVWDGNVALAGHNRGNSAYFNFIMYSEIGDTLTYTTKYGSRTYRIYTITQVNELDSSSLYWSAENILTLITCVADVPEMRYCVKAIEVK